MASRRIERVNEQLRAEISELIGRHMKDPRLHGMISVTEVETSPDLRRAKVFVSILGTAEERKETLAALQHAAGFFRHELRERLRMKRTPEIDLRLDNSIERGDRIMRLLRQVQDESMSAQNAPETPAVDVEAPRSSEHGEEDS
ncbi:MAG: 30S ribosome-binding factor RbfA [Chloroflexi bacterium]|nr:30S ribosome-binding factor RbfA [Chloroflexota bacterium]